MAVQVNVGDVVKFTTKTSNKTLLGIVEEVVTISESTIPSDVAVKEYSVNTLINGVANERIRDSNISNVYAPETSEEQI